MDYIYLWTFWSALNSHCEHTILEFSMLFWGTLRCRIQTRVWTLNQCGEHSTTWKHLLLIVCWICYSTDGKSISSRCFRNHQQKLVFCRDLMLITITQTCSFSAMLEHEWNTALHLRRHHTPTCCKRVTWSPFTDTGSLILVRISI